MTLVIGRALWTLLGNCPLGCLFSLGEQMRNFLVCYGQSGEFICQIG